MLLQRISTVSAGVLEPICSRFVINFSGTTCRLLQGLLEMLLYEVILVL